MRAELTPAKEKPTLEIFNPLKKNFGVGIEPTRTKAVAHHLPSHLKLLSHDNKLLFYIIQNFMQNENRKIQTKCK